MKILIPLEISESDFEKIVLAYSESCENNNLFEQEFFENLLRTIADETSRVTETSVKMNMMNPFGVIMPNIQNSC